MNVSGHRGQGGPEHGPWRQLLGPLQGRGRLAALGAFGLVAVGMHAGADHVDDHVFVLLNTVDGAVDALLSGFIGFTWDLVGASEQTIRRATYRAVTFVDVDTKQALAAHLALVLEVLAVLLVGLPLMTRDRGPSRGSTLSVLMRAVSDPTVLRVVGPVVIALVCAAGVVTVAQEIQVLAHEMMVDRGASAAVARAVARGVGGLALILPAWWVTPRAILHGVHRADRLAAADVMNLVSPYRRRSRGLWTAVVALPLAFSAVFFSAPLAQAVKAILAG